MIHLRMCMSLLELFLFDRKQINYIDNYANHTRFVNRLVNTFSTRSWVTNTHDTHTVNIQTHINILGVLPST